MSLKYAKSTKNLSPSLFRHRDNARKFCIHANEILLWYAIISCPHKTKVHVIHNIIIKP